MDSIENVILEACVDSLDNAILAEKNGADRIELCADLSIDGVTPSRETIKKAHQNLSIPIKVMIRPRGGDFIYSVSEFEKMISDIRYCREIGILEIATGILTESNHLDIHKLEVLSAIAYPMKITIHKCIDLCHDPVEQMKKLTVLENISAVLSSGKALTAQEGIPLLQDMIGQLSPRFEVIPAGKITHENLISLHQSLNAQSYHGRKIVM